MSHIPRKKNELIEIDRLFESISNFSFNKNILNEAPQSVDASKYKHIDFRDGVVGNSKPSKDKINPSLLADVDKAAGIAGTKASITTAVSGHGKGSRHEVGLAVDVAMFDGKGYRGVESAKANKIYDKIVKFVGALEKMGYKVNSERGNDKAVLWFGFPNHHHHVHVSRKSDDGTSSIDDSKSSQSKESSSETTPKIKKIVFTAFPAEQEKIIDGVLKKLDSEGVKDNFSKIVLASLVIYNLEESKTIKESTEDGSSNAKDFISKIKDKEFTSLDDTLDFFEKEFGVTDFNKPEIKKIAEKFTLEVGSDSGTKKIDLELLKKFTDAFKKRYEKYEVAEEITNNENLNEQLTRVKDIMKKIL